MSRFDWFDFGVSIGPLMVATGALLILFFCYPSPEPQPQHTCPIPATTPSSGPVTVEWTHGDGKVTVQLGGAGYPVVMNPGTGKRWILLPVKTP